MAKKKPAPKTTLERPWDPYSPHVAVKAAKKDEKAEETPSEAGETPSEGDDVDSTGAEDKGTPKSKAPAESEETESSK